MKKLMIVALVVASTLVACGGKKKPDAMKPTGGSSMPAGSDAPAGGSDAKPAGSDAAPAAGG